MTGPADAFESNAGGAALFSGANYQAAVATYVATTIVTEFPQQLDAAFPPGTPRQIGLEQGWPIDDIAVWIGDSIVWVQAKRRIDVGDLRDALAQFVLQERHGRGREPGEPFHEHDRFMLAYEDGPAWASRLPTLLEHIRSAATPGELPHDRNADYQRLVASVRNTWTDATPAQVHELLRRTSAYHARSTGLGDTTRAMLANFVEPNVVIAASGVLFTELTTVAARRALRDVATLRELLARAAIIPKPRLAVRADVDRLRSFSDRTITDERRQRALETPDGPVHFQRRMTPVVVDALRRGNLAVIAEAGAGKSMVLLDAADELRAAGELVIFLNAELAPPRLDHELDELFTLWPEAPQTGYLFIDGLDALRVPEQVTKINALIGKLTGTRWHIVISSRDYDLQYSGQLQRRFPADPLIPYQEQDPRYRHCAHIVVGELTTDEQVTLEHDSPTLAALIANASPSLAALLRNPFNLWLAAGIIGSAGDLSNIHSRDDLLDRWWAERVASPDFGRERVLETLARAMIADRRLRTNAIVVPSGAPTTELFSRSVIMRYEGQAPVQVSFRHSTIFDYTVERLLLTGEGATAALLVADRDAFVFILPSLRAFFTKLFDEPSRFFAEMRTLADSDQRATLLLILTAIAADGVLVGNELGSLFDGDPVNVRAFAFIVRAYIRRRQRAGDEPAEHRAAWAAVVAAATNAGPAYAFDAGLLLDEMTGSKHD